MIKPLCQTQFLSVGKLIFCSQPLRRGKEGGRAWSGPGEITKQVAAAAVIAYRCTMTNPKVEPRRFFHSSSSYFPTRQRSIELNIFICIKGLL